MSVCTHIFVESSEIAVSSLSFDHFKFLDSAAFLAASLDTLASNLYDGGKGKHKFTHSLKYNDKEHIDLLLKKGPFYVGFIRRFKRFVS
eukprot:SAG22_NODE_649_length_8157_cov_30.400099_4_plen_89_part_00